MDQEHPIRVTDDTDKMIHNDDDISLVLQSIIKLSQFTMARSFPGMPNLLSYFSQFTTYLLQKTDENNFYTYNLQSGKWT